jgi:uncharacterized membrane protein
MKTTASGRPVVEVPRSGLELLLEFAGAASLISTFLTIALSWSDLPETIPMHFNAAGQVNGWGPKESILAVPCVAIFVFLLLTIASRYPQYFNFPWRITEENAERQYRLARILLAAIKLDVALTCFLAITSLRGAALHHTAFNPIFFPFAIASVPAVLITYFVVAIRSR